MLNLHIWSNLLLLRYILAT